NNEILRNGFAEIYTLGSYHPYLSKFKASEKYAKTRHLNIWQEKGGLALSPSKYRQKQKKVKSAPLRSD
ncbi:MAG: hypothetical protein LW817_07260, partial [Candidatus Caenarcaniphilales bacterium]|nr:hypothetical protein [Candidatus Caenarcaniphilales bacterium]